PPVACYVRSLRIPFMTRLPPRSSLCPYTTLFRSVLRYFEFLQPGILYECPIQDADGLLVNDEGRYGRRHGHASCMFFLKNSSTVSSVAVSQADSKVLGMPMRENRNASF